MSENMNHEAMGLFPVPDSLPAKMGKSAVMAAAWHVAESARAAIDELTERSDELTEEDQLMLGSIAEQLATHSEDLYNKHIDK